MELLDRYLQAVRKHLPAKRQDDILAELRVNLEAQLDDKQEELGRSLTYEEAVAWLKQVGPPIQVAGRYQPVQYLIGPGTFPAYWYVLRLALGWSALLYAIVCVVTIFSSVQSADANLNPGELFGQAVGDLFRLPFVLMTVAAWVTLAFAAFELAAAHGWIKGSVLTGWQAEWNPRTLPPIELTPTGEQVRSYAKAVAEVIFGFLVIAWLLLIPHHPWVLMGPGAAILKAQPYTLAPVWWTFYWLVIALNVVQLAWKCIELDRGTWQQPQPVRKVVEKALGLAPAIAMLVQPDRMYVLLRNPAEDMARYGATLVTINYWVFRGLLIILAIGSIQFLVDLWQVGTGAWRKRQAA